MTEEAAAQLLCKLLNEIEEAGHVVGVGLTPTGIWVGATQVAEPPIDGQLWEIRG